MPKMIVSERRSDMGRTAHLAGVQAYTLPDRLGGFLIVNARAGSARPSIEELSEAAAARGIEVHLFEAGEDVADLARRADADTLGVAGGDGSLAPVASVAIERDLPFVCVPYGTRNHFARDLGLDRDDPIAALEGFDGVERRIDVGRINDRVFLNNVSLGMYANLVHEREQHRRRRQALARVRAIAIALRSRDERELLVDGERISVRILLVSNNAYALEVFSLGERERLDEGLLYLYAATGIVRSSWTERSGTRFVVDAPGGRINAAMDGEPETLGTPLEFRIDPLALRVLVPPA
jgi:diacylglycerol kinase family enzyme